MADAERVRYIPQHKATELYGVKPTSVLGSKIKDKEHRRAAQDSP